MKEKINEILQKLNDIEYGWVDREGIVHKKSSRDFFMNNYRLQTLDETLEFKIGTCWEQAEIIRNYLEREVFSVETFFIMYNDPNKIARHTIAVSQEGDNYYLIDNYWRFRDNLPVSNRIEEILLKVINLFPQMYKINNFDFSKIEIYKYKKPNPGLTFEEFTEYCRSQEKISLEEYFLEKLNEFYIYANKGFYVDEVLIKDCYTLVYSNFIKDNECNYVIDLKEKINFSEIEKDVETEMKRIDAKPCYIITPMCKLYDKREKYFKKDKYKNSNTEVWQIFDAFYNIEKIDSKCEFDVTLERATDMKKIAEITEKAFITEDKNDPYGRLDSGYARMFENYKGNYGSNYSRDIYFIKVNEEIVGITMSVYDDIIYGIYNLAIIKEYRGKGIGTEVLKKQIKLCKKKERKVVFLQTEEGFYPAELYRKIGFKDICKVYYYTLKE